jgi:hypothetical protein
VCCWYIINKNILNVRLAMQLKKKIFISIFCLILIMASGFIFQIYLKYVIWGVPDGGNADSCAQLYNHLNGIRSYTISPSRPGRPAISCSPGSSGLFMDIPYVLNVYYITDVEEQMDIVKKLKSLIKVSEINIIIDFYAKENWKEYKRSNGIVTGGIRGKENKISSYKVN